MMFGTRRPASPLDTACYTLCVRQYAHCEATVITQWLHFMTLCKLSLLNGLTNSRLITCSVMVWSDRFDRLVLNEGCERNLFGRCWKVRKSLKPKESFEKMQDTPPASRARKSALGRFTLKVRQEWKRKLINSIYGVGVNIVLQAAAPSGLWPAIRQ